MDMEPRSKTQTRKGRFYMQNWFFVLIACIIAAAALGVWWFIHVTPVNKAPVQAPQSTIDKSSTISNSKSVRDVSKDYKTVYSAGQYTTGKNLTAGAYAIFPTSGIAYYQISKDTSGKATSILASESPMKRSLISLKNGEVLLVRNAQIVPYKEVKPITKTALTDGDYLVGTDLKAGDYTIKPFGATAGYYQIAKDMSHTLTSIIKNANFNNTQKITLEKGQLLTLNNAQLTK